MNLKDNRKLGGSLYFIGRPGRQRDCARNQQVVLANRQHLTVDYIGENGGLTNPKTAILAMKNPGALAGASEVKRYKKAGELSRAFNLICAPCASLAVQHG